MTIEEAIIELKKHISLANTDANEALNMAIKSLEALRDITVLFDQWTSGELNDGQYHFQMQNLILFGKTLAEVSDDNN